MNLTQAQDLLKYLSPEKELPEEMHGWRFDTPLPDGWETYDMPRERLVEFIEYLTERCRRAESIRVPEGLRESIKAAMLAAMDAQHAFTDAYYDDDISTDGEQYNKLFKTVRDWKALCAPDSPPSETNREEVKG